MWDTRVCYYISFFVLLTTWCVVELQGELSGAFIVDIRMNVFCSLSLSIEKSGDDVYLGRYEGSLKYMSLSWYPRARPKLPNTAPAKAAPLITDNHGCGSLVTWAPNRRTAVLPRRVATVRKSGILLLWKLVKLLKSFESFEKSLKFVLNFVVVTFSATRKPVA